MKQGSPEPIAALNRIHIVESDEPLVDIRDICPAVDVTEKVCPYLRATVAVMLNQAAASLPAGYSFRIGTALRTRSMQMGGWDRYFQKMKDEHPEWPYSALRRATNRYHAPYDQPAPPGHCTGGAVDVILLGPDGEPADVISPTKDWEAAYTWSDKISAESKRNRMTIVESMLNAGFSNCREEYWHYSYGDSAWAVRMGKRSCPYGFIEPEPTVEARFEGAAAGVIERRSRYEWICSPAIIGERPQICVGIFWAEGVEVTLRVNNPSGLLPTLHYGPDREQWDSAETTVEGDFHVYSVAPSTPRFYLSSNIPMST